MIRLPYPISANRYWRIVNGHGRAPARIMVSDEAKSYKRQVGVLAQLHGFNPPTWPAPKGQPVEVCIQLHPRSIKAPTKPAGSAQEALKASAVVLDLDNCVKVTLDALNGVAWVDDSQVKRLSAEYGPACVDGALSVWIGWIRHGDTSSICPVSEEFA
jgi:crossover junction endodeoxyribonuclease RusA